MDVRDEPKFNVPDSGTGPLRRFRIGRRAVLQSLASGAGAVAFASQAPAQHVHQAAAAAANAAAPEFLFLDRHAFDTLSLIADQIVPGARAAQIPEFLDRLLAVESTDTQRRAMQAIGAFEGAAREAHGKPWKALTAPEANALLTKISAQPDSEPARRAFEDIKVAVAETYFETEAGKKDLGWDGSVTFAPPAACT